MLPQWNNRKGEAGFTLVEIAIVIVIIGLLIGGVLKGRSMIENAKATRIMRHSEELRTAILSFSDKFGVLPGDESRDDVPIGGTDSEGDGDGFMESSESYDLFLDLQIAGLISGSYDGTSQYPQHAFGNTVRMIWTDAPGDGGYDHFFIFNYIPGKVAAALDIKYDDGVYNTGTLLANQDYTNTSVHFYVQY